MRREKSSAGVRYAQGLRARFQALDSRREASPEQSDQMWMSN